MTAATTNTETPAMSAFWENVRTILYALALAMVIRFTIAQPFRIPSSSMVPTLEVGDYVAVTKWSYGYGRYSFAPLEGILPSGRLFGHEPKLGDVVVFRPPSEPQRDFIKRIVGMPGDRIQVRDGRLYRNDEAVPRELLGVRELIDEHGIPYEAEAYQETLPDGGVYIVHESAGDLGGLDNTGVFVVPEGHYFMMGDNRDNSSDSRAQFRQGTSPMTVRRDNCAGSMDCYVPYDNLVGPAQVVIVSFDQTTSIYKPWTLFTGFRGDRFMKAVD